MESLVGRILAAYGVARRAFGVYVLPLFAMWVFANIRLAVAFFMFLDGLFFSKLKEAKPERPIVLVGNPRTGTTFLQRFLSDNGYGKGMEIWQMLYPSLTLQVFIRPFLPILELISPAKYHSTPAHHTSLTSVETDDVSILFRYFDGFFLYGFFMAFDEEDLQDKFDPEARGVNDRDFAWLEALWARSMVTNDTDVNIAKLFSLGPRMPAFQKRFPKARVLYMVRDPVSILPSAMSLVTGVLDNAFGFWKLPTELQERWFERMYNGLVMLLRRFHDDWVEGRIDQSKVFIVRYDRMMGDFESMMADMNTFLEVDVSEELQATIDARGVKQREYKSGHKYDLAKFKLTEERIREDCAFFYETFLPDMKVGE